MAQNIKKVITSTMVGNGLEWYDYALYGHFAALIAMHFFPKGDEHVALIATFGIFAAGFLMRPIGAMFFGYFGDKYGRKNALAVSILMMAIPTGLIGLLPTFEQWGLWAPILLTLIRLLQGIAIGGEFGGSIVYMVEHATEKNKNLLGSTSIISMLIGVMAGALISTGLAEVMSEAEFNEWGWRIPFIVGFFIGIIGLYIRTHLDESPAFMDAKETGHLSDKPIKDALKENYKEIFLGIGVYLSVTIPFYIQTVFMSSFMHKNLHFSSRDSLLIISMSMLIMMFVTPISAILCDRFNREKILKYVCLAYLIYAFPFIHLLNTENFNNVIIAQIIFSIILAFYIAPIPSLMVDIFPTKTRYTGMSLACNVSAAVFGGTAPMIITWMIGEFNSNFSIAWFIIFAAIVSYLCIRKVRTKFHYNI